MLKTKARELHIWIREQGYSFYILVAFLIFLVVKSLFDLGENLRAPGGCEYIDVMPNKLALFLLILWLLQIPIFYKKTTKITASATFLLIFVFLIVAYFLTTYVWVWVTVLRDSLNGEHPFHIPSWGEYNIVGYWIGFEVWQKDFPWGGILFPFAMLLFYMAFIFYLVFHLEMKNKASLIVFSCLTLLTTLLLLSAIMEALLIIREGVNVTRLSSTGPLEQFLVDVFKLQPLVI